MRELDRSMMASVAGHFGELMQGRLGANGPLALISLPCPPLCVTATRRPARGLHIHAHGMITPVRARQFLAHLGLGISGRIALTADMPIGGGAGSSTAALVALARLAGWHGAPHLLARACILSEGASDPLMHPNAAQILWAPREGRILAPMPALPAFDILGGFYGPAQRTDAADLHFSDISDLVHQWQAARSLTDFAAIAAQSAQRTLALRGPVGDPTARLAHELGAMGYVIAHTGTARGLIFARGGVPENGRAALIAAGLRAPLIFGYRNGI
jgi:uncharacterized protein involved in propanediol utilization